jgi:SNF2 family DNA or RNA helicase
LARRLCEGASIVVADEAHTIKNPASKTNRAMGKIRTRARLALTGYPLQNNLEEYYCMIHWVGG